MELKYQTYPQCRATRPSFNRTIMELKFVILSYFLFCFFAFNRTIMELKCIIVAADAAVPVTFNRTIMELKFFW